MSIGFHDSVLPNGKRIREDREALSLSREALVASSGRSFSVKTLTRAEAGERVSKEKLASIATGLGFDVHRYDGGSAKPGNIAHHVFNIHHWDDEYEEYLDLVTFLKCMAEDATGTDATIVVLDDDLAAKILTITISVIKHPEVKFNYIFYDSIVNFSNSISRRYSRANDLIIVDLMAASGDANLSTQGLMALRNVENLINNDRTYIFSAHPSVIDMASEKFRGYHFVSKVDAGEIKGILGNFVIDAFEKLKIPLSYN